MARIIVVTCFETSGYNKAKKLVASHGVDEDSGKSVCLPGEHPSLLGASFDPEIGEWVIPNKQ